MKVRKIQHEFQAHQFNGAHMTGSDLGWLQTAVEAGDVVFEGDRVRCYSPGRNETVPIGGWIVLCEGNVVRAIPDDEFHRTFELVTE